MKMSLVNVLVMEIAFTVIVIMGFFDFRNNPTLENIFTYLSVEVFLGASIIMLYLSHLHNVDVQQSTDK